MTIKVTVINNDLTWGKVIIKITRFCHGLSMVTKLVTPDVEEKKLSTCPETKMIWSVFWNMNLSPLTDFYINEEALWLLVGQSTGLLPTTMVWLTSSLAYSLTPVICQSMCLEKSTDIQKLLLSWNKIYIWSSHIFPRISLKLSLSCL